MVPWDGARQSAAMVMTYLLRNSPVSVPEGFIPFSSWWRHQMGTCSTLPALWAGNSPVTSEFPSQRPVMRSFDVFFDLCLNKLLSKQSRRQWFETSSCSLWCHCYVADNRNSMWARSVPCFSMPWLLSLTDHQQPLYWPWEVKISW